MIPWKRLFSVMLVLCLAAFSSAARGELPEAAPAEVGMDANHLNRIDEVVRQGLESGNMPGCVVCIGRHGKIVFLQAYGDRQVEPTREVMTVDTLFDMASVTKPVATATSVMLLLERGQIRLSDRVASHLLDFRQNGKGRVTIQDLLIHQGGLLPDNALADYEDGSQEALRRIYALDLRAEPGTRYIYTDVGFIVLAELVKAKTGQDVHQFSQENVFGPLGMRDTGYLPGDAHAARAATTESREGRWMRGEVHDPRAYLLGGIAGHAGLFSTARDLAVYAQMMLQQGVYRGTRILSPATVRLMTNAYPVSRGTRGLGWDKRTSSSNRGELFSPQAFGHGGFTGNAFWVDPEFGLFTIFLSNRVHPDGRGSVNPLAGRINTIAVASIRREATEQETPGQPHAAADVLPGIDVLARDGFRALAGRQVGLITNHTGIDREGRRTVEILHDAPDVALKALFSPEHGFAGQLEQRIIGDSQDAGTGLQIFSLYGQTRRPTEEMLAGLDTLVFDIQDIGTRFYTYVSTMGEAMEAAAEHGLQFVVLDRPNPINGRDVAGPVLDSGRESFVGFHRVPVRHGMTAGELAQMIRAERGLDLDLRVVRVDSWQRAMFFDQTGLLWVNPSPNMRSLTEALLYPGIGLLETTNLSVGRGTDTPFEVIGAPWLDGRRLAESLAQSGLPGVAFVPIRFTPDASKFQNEPCGGINMVVTNREQFQPLKTGLEIARQLRILYPEDWRVDAYDRLLGSQQVLEAIRAGTAVSSIEAGYADQLAEFLKRRSQFLLY